MSNLCKLVAYNLSIIPCDIDQFNYVHIINFSNGFIKILPKEIFALDLTELILRENQVEILPREIIKFKNIKVLNIIGNHLSKLPREVLELNMLISTGLNDNIFIDTCPASGPKNRLLHLLSNGYIE